MSGYRPGGGASGATPGGSDGQIQYNDDGALGGVSALSWDGTTISVTAETMKFAAHPTYPNGSVEVVKIAAAAAPFSGATVGTGLQFRSFGGAVRGGVYVSNSGVFTIEDSTGARITFSAGGNVNMTAVSLSSAGSNFYPQVRMDATSGKEIGWYVPSFGGEEARLAVSRTDVLTATPNGVDVAGTLSVNGAEAALKAEPTIPAFTDLTDQVAGDVIASAAVTVTGDVDTVWPATVRGDGNPQMQVAGGAWARSDMIRAGDSVALRLTSSADALTARTATLYAPGVSRAWAVTTSVFAPEAEVVAWRDAVETADGEPLENAVVVAVNNFVLGAKADGWWSNIAAAGLMAGARTLTGALVPLVGPAVTNVGFVSADYTRTTGLKGNGSSKRLLTGIGNADSDFGTQNDKHAAVYRTETESLSGVKAAFGTPAADGATILVSTTTRFFRCNSPLSGGSTADNSTSTGLWGVSRSSSASLVGRSGGVSQTINDASMTPSVADYSVFDRGTLGNYSDMRASWWSTGAALDLEQLEGRLDTLLSALAAAVAS